jgi:hypothetical protein
MVADYFLLYLVNRLHPPLTFIEILSICDIIYQQNPMSSSVKLGGDGAESLLTSSIPYLRHKIKESISDAFHYHPPSDSMIDNY